MRYAILFLFLVSSTFGEESFFGIPFPVPNETELVSPRTAVQEIFGDRIETAKTEQEKSELASELLAIVNTTKDRFERYAILEQVQRLALDAKDMTLSLRSVDLLAETFQIDPVDSYTSLLTKLFDNKLEEKTIRQLAEIEISAKGDTPKKIAAAEAWYDLAKTQNDLLKLSAKKRALLHYQSVWPHVSGLKKLQVEKRIKECATIDTPPQVQGRYGHGRIIEIDCTQGLSPMEAIRAQRNAAKAYGVPVDFTNSIGMTFRFIPAGTFVMGSPENEPGRDADEKQYVVKIAKPFYIGTTEVTQEQYWKVTGQKPSELKDHPNNPVEKVNWPEASEFCVKLTKLDGERIYQLPTTTQWEYASRAGVLEATYGPIHKIAWNRENSHGRTQPVGTLAPNAWGLFDCLGNVWEWCDREDRNAKLGCVGGRGLSMIFEPEKHRLADYSKGDGLRSFNDSGFRVCILLDSP